MQFHNETFFDFDLLNEMGLLRKSEYQKEFYGSNPLDVDYASLFYAKIWQNTIPHIYEHICLYLK